MDSSLIEETETPITPTLKKRKCLIGDVHLKQNAKAEPLLGKLMQKQNHY